MGERFSPEHSEAAFQSGLSASEHESIQFLADQRRRRSDFKAALIQLEVPEQEVLQDRHEKLRSFVIRAADEERAPKARPDTSVESLTREADRMRSITPNLAALKYARAAEMAEAKGADAQATLQRAKDVTQHATELPQLVPAELLPNAIILGIEKRSSKRLSVPSTEKIAQDVVGDKKLLANWALTMPESERDDFLAQVPADVRPRISREIDLALSPLLHQSLIEKNTVEGQQRSQVRRRLYKELRTTLSNKNKSERVTVKTLARAVGGLGADTRQLLLDTMREESEELTGAKFEAGHLPRVLKVFMDNFDDWRGNDVILRLAGDRRLEPHLASYLFRKLADKNYLEKEVAEWLKPGEVKSGQSLRQAEKRRLEVLQSVVTDLGVMPSPEILEYLHADRNWSTAKIASRVATVREQKVELDKFTDSRALVRHLKGDERAAMIYFMLHGGEDRFNLINNYDFGRFREMLGLIDQLEVHAKPLQDFEQALRRAGLNSDQARQMLERLRAGHYPGQDQTQAYQEVSFEVSENAAVQNANVELGRVLGKNELGVILRYPLYRDYAAQLKGEQAVLLGERMKAAETMQDRLAVIADLEAAHPEWRERAIEELNENWRRLGEKILIEASLEQVFNEERVPIKAEELLPRLDIKRLDLKRLKKNLLVALRGSNERAQAVVSKITRKKKALGNLRAGLERAQGAGRERLQGQVTNIEAELIELEQERRTIADLKVEERFAELSPSERKQRIQELSKEIIALTEKSPSAIFTFITMQVLGEKRLRESDVTLVQELESHMQGPFQTIQDVLTYQKPSSQAKTRQRVGLRYIDKARDLMHLVRFADSKICCFSSNNYEMVVQYGVPNKTWVASINADPLSFVIALESPHTIKTENRTQPRENLGFIFGSFALDQDNQPAIMLNGIYYAPGLENARQVSSIMTGLKRVFTNIPIKEVAVAGQHGGAIKMPDGFSNTPISLTRLRALDDGSGRPESKIYDDLGTGDNLNQSYTYNAGGAGGLWHARW